MTNMPTEGQGYIPDKILKAEKRITVQSFDTEAWSILIRDAQMKKIEDARQLYERLITQFPNSGRYWKIYIEHEMKSNNFERTEKLFQRCLMKVLNIDLWKTYINYIKETKFNLPTYREKMAQAYDFALDKMGMDIMSYSLWTDYIVFLKSVEAIGSYAENQRITAVRKVYQRGVVNPMINIELLWKEYCNFEHSINPLIGKKMQDDRGRDYQNARRVAKDYESVTKGLNRNQPAIPPQNTPDEVKQVDLWKAYIGWEKANPLRTEDHAMTTRRVMFAFEQALLCLGHHPDIWIEAATYLENASKLLTEKGDQNAGKLFADEASSIYERSVTSLLKENMLLYFAYADFEESRLRYEKVHSIYKRLLDVPGIQPTLVYVQYMKFARRAEGIKAARAVFKLAREDNRTLYPAYVSAALTEYYCSKDKDIAFRIFELGLKKFGSIPEYILAYIDYMAHLNEDNNTRVLFERVLSSSQLDPAQSQEIWTKFLDFESNVGDLSSIMKVEKRRCQIQALGEQESDTSLLIDRYKYMDMMPCSAFELKALGYKDTTQSKSSRNITLLTNGSNEQKLTAQYPMPDTSQMKPFKPRTKDSEKLLYMPGGSFPMPQPIADLLTKIPPPNSFQGPFLKMDEFIEHMQNLTIPDESTIVTNGDEADSGSIQIDSGTIMSIDIAHSKKRKHTEGQGAESDEENMVSITTVPPLHDIYRVRQQKKVK